MKFSTYTILSLLFLKFNFAQAAEPAYCKLENFLKHEVPYKSKSAPDRVRAFKIGQMTLAGMAIGDSKASDVADVAEAFSKSNQSDNYCTWYWSDENHEAENMFTDINLKTPLGSNYDKMTKDFMTKMGDQFHDSKTSFVSCAIEQKYIGMGCDHQKHRGPSVFAMLLAYSGCSPESSANIVNEVWGKNFIKTKMRVSLAQAGQQKALENPEKSQQLRDLFLTN